VTDRRRTPTGTAVAATIGIDTSTASPARIYAYLLGGKDNFPADRAVADKTLAVAPQARVVARTNRAFLQHAPAPLDPALLGVVLHGLAELCWLLFKRGHETPAADRAVPRRPGGRRGAWHVAQPRRCPHHHGWGPRMSGWPLADNPLLAAAQHHAQLGDRMLALHHLHAHWVGVYKFIEGCSCAQPGCPTPTEHPISKHWHLAATSDLATLRRWWSRHPLANPGVVTGERFDVLACDQTTGRIALGVLGDRAGPACWTGGGRLLVFTARSGLDAGMVHCSEADAGRWVVRHGRGEFVPLPPAQHLSGHLAWWARPAGLPLPGWADTQQVLVAAAGQARPRGRLHTAGVRAGRGGGGTTGHQEVDGPGMTAGELAGITSLGVLALVVLGVLAWLDWSAERDQAARRGRQHPPQAYEPLARSRRGEGR
jgi:S-adenosyl methyltransferase/Bifunctional DNA primase/polymerase, N-terminal